MNPIPEMISNPVLAVFYLVLIGFILILLFIKFYEQKWQAFSGPLIGLLLSGIIIYLDIRYEFVLSLIYTNHTNISILGILLGCVLGIALFVLCFPLMKLSIEIEVPIFETFAVFFIVLTGYVYFSQRDQLTYSSLYFPFFAMGFDIALTARYLLFLLAYSKRKYSNKARENHHGRRKIDSLEAWQLSGDTTTDAPQPSKKK